MKCPKCGAENMGGAAYCNSCRAALTSDSSSRSGGGNAAIWIGVVAAAALVVVLLLLFSGGGGGGGGGGVGPAASPSPSSPGGLTVSEKRAVKKAEAVVAKEFPDMLGGQRSVSTMKLGGREVTVVVFKQDTVAESSAGEAVTIPVGVAVTVDNATGKTSYATTF